MSTAIAVPSGFDPSTIMAVDKLARTVAESALIPDSLRNKPSDVLIIMLTGHELGLPPMLALQKVYVIKGRPFISSELLAAKVLGSAACLHFTLTESTEERATYETQRKGAPKPVTLSFTIKEAERAGLTSKDVWKNHRAAMLRARAAAALARVVYPDVIMGFDAAAEVELEEDRFQAARSVSTPAPAAKVADEPTDAEIVPEVDAAEMDAQAIAFWTERFNEAPTLAVLDEVSAGLRQSKPSKTVRAALVSVYGNRKALLAGGEPTE